MNFQCSWDATVTSTTTINFVSMLVVIIIAIFFAIRYWKREKKLHSLGCWLVVIISIILLVFPALFCPLSVSVENESISIHRIKGDIVIPFDDITEIRMVNDSDTENGTRNFGSGGDYGYLGKFSSPQLGDYQMYATDASKKILVKNNKGESIIFSCDRPDELIRIVNTMR